MSVHNKVILTKRRTQVQLKETSEGGSRADGGFEGYQLWLYWKTDYKIACAPLSPALRGRKWRTPFLILETPDGGVRINRTRKEVRKQNVGGILLRLLPVSFTLRHISCQFLSHVSSRYVIVSH